MALTRLVLELALIDGASAGVRGLSSQLQRMGTEGQKALRLVNGAMDDLQGGLKALSSARALKESLVDPGLQAAATLETALRNLEVNLDQGSLEQVKRQLSEVELNAARIAGPTKFNQAEAIGIHTDLKKAGLSLSDITGQGGAAEAVTQLASAEGLDASQAVGAVTTLGSIFGLSGSQYSGAADLLARAGAASNTDAAELREALAQAPSAGSMKLDPTETLASLGVMANMGVRGGAAGTALNAFLRDSAAKNRRMNLGLFDDGGNFVGMQAAAAQLQKRTAGMTPEQTQNFLTRAFGDEGARMGLGLLKGQGGLAEVMAGMGQSRSLQDKVARLSDTQAASREALGGTVESTLATLFQPALDPLKRLASTANDWVGQVGDASRADPRLAQATSYGAMGAVGVAGLYGVARLARGGARGLGALGSIGGLLGSRAGGLAEAKALEAAAGVQPVSVVNWPAGFGGGMLGGETAAAAAGGSGIRMLPLAAAGLAGLGVGTAIEQQLSKSELGSAAMDGAVASAVLSNPLFRLVAETYDAVTGGNTVGALKAGRAEASKRAINVVVKMLPGGGAEVEVDDDGDVQRAMARAGAR